MANELRTSISVSYSKNGETEQASANKATDVSGDVVQAATVSVGTAEEAVAMGDVAAPGYVFIQNLDAANYVQFGATTGVYTIKLLAGESSLFRLNGTTLFAKANTADCLVKYKIFSA